ncbi:hypothetical protein [Nonomuraea sp. NPDC050310]|uniref:hypothetical protein n=1 Tax=unclassified Nonomuraea TaxID=2593643 RepID=UPI0033F97998
MGEQFDVIEAGTPRRRRRLGVALLALVVAVPLAGWLISRDPEPAQQAERQRPEPISTLVTVGTRPNVLTPTPRLVGGEKVLDLVFPDGRRAELRYPADLDFESLGIRPFQGAVLRGETMNHYRQLVAPFSGEVEITKGGQPLRHFTPNVTLWPRPSGSNPGQVLLFGFGDWRLALYDRPNGLTFDQRMTWARNLKGTVTPEGFLTLSATGPLRLSKPGEYGYGREPAGPQLWFGTSTGHMLVLVPLPGCRRNLRPPSVIMGTGSYGWVCRSGVYIGVAGPRRYIDHALESVEITVK